MSYRNPALTPQCAERTQSHRSSLCELGKNDAEPRSFHEKSSEVKALRNRLNRKDLDAKPILHSRWRWSASEIQQIPARVEDGAWSIGDGAGA